MRKDANSGFFVACAFVLLPSCREISPTHVDFATAKAAYEKVDFPTALAGLKPFAEQGNPEARFLTGKIYERGGVYKRGGAIVSPDYSQALRWYRASAEKQNSAAEEALGDAYSEGYGVPKDDRKALGWYKLASQHGNGAASFALGIMYFHGRGVAPDRCEAVRLGSLAIAQGEPLGHTVAEGAYNPRERRPEDPVELLKWLKCGVDNGVAAAQVAMGLKYYEGDGVPRNYAEAARMFSAAANRDDANSSINVARSLLGDLYASGRGVERDLVKAASLYRLAADAGYPDAQYKMGNALALGLGVPQDYSEAVRYFRRAAEEWGDTRAEGRLAAAYAIGRGVPQNYIQAHVWSNLASVGGDDKLRRLRGIIEERMTPVQLAEAQRLAREWKPKHQN